MKSTQDILDERQAQHGSYRKFCEIKQKFNAILEAHGEQLTIEESTSLDMIFFKASRILNKGAKHADNWQDIAGYAMLGGGLYEQQDKQKSGVKNA